VFSCALNGYSGQKFIGRFFYCRPFIVSNPASYCSKQQGCGTGTGTAGTVTFGLSGTVTGSITVPVYEPDLDPDPTQKWNKKNKKIKN
jgi:hypothetical protein